MSETTMRDSDLPGDTNVPEQPHRLWTTFTTLDLLGDLPEERFEVATLPFPCPMAGETYPLVLSLDALREIKAEEEDGHFAHHLSESGVVLLIPAGLTYYGAELGALAECVHRTITGFDGSADALQLLFEFTCPQIYGGGEVDAAHLATCRGCADEAQRNARKDEDDGIASMFSGGNPLAALLGGIPGVRVIGVGGLGGMFDPSDGGDPISALFSASGMGRSPFVGGGTVTLDDLAEMDSEFSDEARAFYGEQLRAQGATAERLAASGLDPAKYGFTTDESTGQQPAQGTGE